MHKCVYCNTLESLSKKKIPHCWWLNNLSDGTICFNFENSSIKILIHLTYFRIFKSDLKWPWEEIIHCRNLLECHKSLKLLMRMCVTILSLTSETGKQTIKREKLKSAQQTWYTLKRQIQTWKSEIRWPYFHLCSFQRHEIFPPVIPDHSVFGRVLFSIIEAI